MITDIVHPDDWARDVYDVRVRRLIVPNVDLDGDGVDDRLQSSEIQVKTRHSEHSKPKTSSAPGHIINGQFFTREQIEQMRQEREREYFDLMPLVKKVNHGLEKSFMVQRDPQRLAKLMSVDSAHLRQEGKIDINKMLIKY
mmetsp:Transcript_3619/g.6153  ORF Transcript_3619/g.6153 Transcript_3619/m.6153 type:complete len:141 (-) Transcript_3619:16-438(-)